MGQAAAVGIPQTIDFAEMAGLTFDDTDSRVAGPTGSECHGGRVP